MSGLLSPVTALMVLSAFIFSRQTPPPRPPLTSRGGSSATVVTSPVAAVTWVTRDGNHAEIDLIVVWRGTPGWFRASPQGSSGGGGGRPATFHTTITYGTVRLSMSLTSNPRVATIQETRVPLQDHNVVLVDHVDSATGPEVVKTLTIDPSFTDPQRIGPVLGRSPEIVEFLRCGVRLESNLDTVLQKLCAEVIGK